MLEILTINDFQILTPPQQSAILKEMKTKTRLDSYLQGLNKKKKKNIGSRAPFWVSCHHCKGSGRPGEIKIIPRDNTDIHPSSIIRCIKKLWFDCSTYDWVDPQTGVVSQKSWADLGVDNVHPRLRRIFDFGSAWHEVIQGYGSRGAFGPKKNYLPELKIDPDNGYCNRAEALWIKGAVDAVLDPYVLEVPGMGTVAIRIIHEYKTINSRGYGLLKKPKTDHVWQAAIYSYVLDIPIVVYIYLNKDNQQMSEFALPFNQPLWTTIEEKIEYVQELVETKQSPPWEKTSAVLTPSECTECPYLQYCQPPQQAVKTKRRK